MNLFLLQAWIPQLFDYWNNGGSWSISVEMFFYILFPFLQKILNKLQMRLILLIGVIAYLFAILLGFSYILFPKDYAVRIVYSIPIFRLPEFIIGIVTGVFFTKSDHLKVNYSLVFITCIGVIIIYLGLCGRNNSGYLVHNFLMIPLITLLIYSAALCRSGIIFRLLSSKPLVILGHASYSFYSYQILIILSLAPIYKKFFGEWPIMSMNSIFFLSLFCCLATISLFSYRFIEEPSRRFINQKFE